VITLCARAGRCLVAAHLALAACAPAAGAPGARLEDGPRAPADVEPGPQAIDVDASAVRGLARSDAAPRSACDVYCARVAARCVGSAAPYPTTATCLAACDALDDAAVRCRSEQAERGACVAAGLSGGAACGDRCEAFCTVAVHTCGGPDAPFVSVEACLSACGPGRGFAFDPTRGELDEGDATDDLNCRQARLVEALLDGLPENAARACPELGPSTHPGARCVM